MDGPLLVSSIFCPCDSCEAFDFSPGACKMRHDEYGAFKLEYARAVLCSVIHARRAHSLLRPSLCLSRRVRSKPLLLTVLIGTWREMFGYACCLVMPLLPRGHCTLD